VSFGVARRLGVEPGTAVVVGTAAVDVDGVVTVVGTAPPQEATTSTSTPSAAIRVRTSRGTASATGRGRRHGWASRCDADGWLALPDGMVTDLMAWQSDAIVWRLHLQSPPEEVFDAIDSGAGRAGFWAESAEEIDGVVTFGFIDGTRISSRIVERRRPSVWSVEYFGSVAQFTIEPDGAGGTDLTLRDTGVAAADRAEVTAGWLNVLLPLKAWVDYGIDLRNHDPARTWRQGYVDQ
jgi:uncharacterized protein YndB with AHSA1/START domain